MQTRTGLVWMLLGLLSVAPLAAAQSSDDRYPIGIWAEHDHLSAAPGDSVTFSLHVGTHTGPHNVTLSADALPDGLVGAFGSPVVSPAPQAYASTTFVVSIASDARARESIPIMLHGVDEVGHSTSLRVYMRIAQPATNSTTPPSPEPASPPTPAPGPTPPPTPAPTPPPTARPEFALYASPASLKLAPGGSASALVYVKANAAMHIDLQAIASSGYSALLSVNAVDITPGEPMRLNLTLSAGADASSPGTVDVVGVSGEQKRASSVHVELVTPPKPEGSFMMRVEPATQSILPGGEASFVLHFKAARNVTLDLEAGRHSGEGYAARFEPATFDIAAGGEAKALMTVTANQTADRYGAIQVLAKAHNSTEQRDAIVKLALLSPTASNATTPPPAPHPTNESMPPTLPTPPKSHEQHPSTAPSAPTTMLGNGIEIGIEGFDHAGGLRISVRVGDGNVMHVRLGPDALRGVLRESKTGGADVGHHSPLWIRLQLDDGAAAEAPASAGALDNA